jgi:lipopolysaccharide transport system permease protein
MDGNEEADMTVRNLKAATVANRRPVSIIGPAGSDTLTYLRRVWHNRHVMRPLCYNFLAATYHSTILGAWWLVIRSILPTLGMIAIFQHVKSLQPQTLPYPLYVISGTTLWMIVALALPKGTRCLRIARRFHMNMGFPKIMVPLASMSFSVVHALMFFVVLLGGIAYYYIFYNDLYLAPLWRMSLLPLVLILIMLLTTGIISFSSVLFLVARDVRMLLLFAVQLWFYFTPVAYPLEILPGIWRTAVLYLNPMASLIELGRWSLLGVGTVEWPAVITSAVVCLLVFWLGMRLMARVEPALSLVRLL